MAARLTDAGYRVPATFVLEHGYCRSLYVRDPNGLLIELTADHHDAAAISATRASSAHDDLAKWLAGDHTSNTRTARRDSLRRRPAADPDDGHRQLPAAAWLVASAEG